MLCVLSAGDESGLPSQSIDASKLGGTASLCSQNLLLPTSWGQADFITDGQW